MIEHTCRFHNLIVSVIYCLLEYLLLLCQNRLYRSNSSATLSHATQFIKSVSCLFLFTANVKLVHVFPLVVLLNSMSLVSLPVSTTVLIIINILFSVFRNSLYFSQCMLDKHHLFQILIYM